MANKKVQVELLDEQTGAVIEPVDVLTSADCVTFTDGETFQQKLNTGKLTGPKGATGAQGIQGAQGPKGDAGLQGAQGPKGEQGLQGAKGATGDRGQAGANGTNGAQGPKGDKGDPGDSIKVGTTIANAVSRKLFFKVVG